ncbi:MAG TPA: BatD family protein [Gemmatimonadaceae bacterium]
MIGLLVLAQLAIVAHAPDVVSACDAVEVTVAVSAPGNVAPQIIAPSFSPFDVLRSSITPHIQLDPRNGGSIIAEYRYVLTTDQAGSFTIPPFEARLRRATARSKPLRITVRGARAGDGVPTVVARARIDTSLDVNFRALTEPETVYVGQQANYEVAVFLNETVRDRLRRNPTFYPPDMQSMLAYDLPPVTGDPPKRKVGTRCFDALVYQRALFPLLPGRFVIAPAQLVYSLPLSSSFFSREESHELVTDSTILVAVDPPSAGRPSEYMGAVGDLAIASRLDSRRGRVGDPMLLTVRLSGAGNVKLFPPPRLEIPWANLVRSDERVQVDSTARRIRGAKEFDWVLTPKIAGEMDVPPIRYGYFNPDTRRYAIAAAAGEHVTIAPGFLANADTVRSEPLLAIRASYRGPVDRPPQEQAYFWLLLSLAPLPALAGRLRRAPRRVTAPSAAAKLRALAHSRAAQDSCEVRRAYANALGERLGVSAERFTRPGALARAMRRAGVSSSLATDAEALLRKLDESAYGPAVLLDRDALERAISIVRQADAEALPRAELRLPRILGLALVAAIPLGVGSAHAISVDDAQVDFDRGVRAYAVHQFAAARSAFASSANRSPWAPDAWANLGTAAWAANDTSGAVIGWQRALRLEPTASDLRDRLQLAQAQSFGSIDYVPPVSSAFTLWMAVGAWLVAWTLATLLTFRRTIRARITLRRWAYGAGMVGLLLLLGGLDLDQRLAARNLTVVRSTTRLSSDPALGGETKGTAIIGEVARAVRREGPWTLVTLDAQREGWVESSNLASLERGASVD